MDSLIHGMKFGLEKCARLIVAKGRVKKTDGLQLNIWNIKDIKFSKVCEIYMDIKISKVSRLRQYQKNQPILKLRPNGPNKTINTNAMSVITYTVGIIA